MANMGETILVEGSRSGNSGPDSFHSPSAYRYPRSLTTTAASDNAPFAPGAITLTDAFFSTFTEIDPFNWSRAFPYQLVIVQASRSGKYSIVKSFTLPIPPQELTTQMPFAINNSITMGGIIEEHNGAPIRLIALSGTMGVLPLRTTGKFAQSSPPVFGGTITAVGNTIGSGKALFSGDAPSNSPAAPDESIAKGSGYYQCLLLQNFLEYYAAAKKEKDNKNMRLAFANWKDKSVLLVTPLVFNVRRSVSSPLEYMYELQLKAFRRINLDASGDKIEVFATAREPSFLAKLLNTAMKAYSLISNVIATVRAIRADIQAVMDVIRSAIVFIKQIVDAVISIIDLPGQLIKDFQATVLGSWEQLKNSVIGADGLQEHMGKAQLGQLGIAQTNKEASSNPITTNAGGKLVASVFHDIFANPTKHVDFLSQIQLADLQNIDPALQAKVQAELDRTASFTAQDFGRMRDDMLSTLAAVSNAIGANDATFDSVYDVVEPAASRTPNADDFQILYALSDMVDVLNYLSVPTDESEMPSLDTYNMAAQQAGVSFVRPNSMFSVPFPYQGSLEELALIYLGNPDRWLEIAAINNLREPYVDEIGFDYSLLTNGKLQTIFVNSKVNLRIGQPIWIQSAYVAREKRHILNIEEIGPGNVLLTLDGEADLAKFKSAERAFIHAFLPDTLNSQMYVYIPSQKSSGNQQDLKNVPGVDPFDPFLELGGVDLLLQGNNDLVITPDGDGRMAYGMGNLVQWSRVALGTVQGSLIRHPKFGLPVKPGMSVADFSAKQLLEAAKSLFSEDPAFTGIVGTSVKAQGPVVTLNLAATVIGQQTPLNLAIQVFR